MNLFGVHIFLIFLSITYNTVKSEKLRIENGYEAEAGMYPYQVRIEIKGMHNFPDSMPAEKRPVHCGGTIISQRYVLTAAHCIHNEEGRVVRILGGNNIRGGEHERVYESEAIAVHKDWELNRQSIRADIALIKTSEDIIFDDYLQPAKLPTSKFELRDNETAIVTGWGLLKAQGRHPVELRALKMKVVNRQKCQGIWEKISKRNMDEFSNNGVICLSGEKGQGVCNSDSGGPAVTTNGVLVGVVSFGDGLYCNRSNIHPDVFTNVPYYLDWIRLKMKSL
ncbi:hypothetical protein TKK_0000827 [Trichogramma kaykai]|uniref:Peptidase S1 domain-containing protein n=1 Tax=Trichogramma kaykai TaxID=54128 RepID=A0ABD2VWQ4_9HYME